jgi:3-oxoacyl-[acyl-carrier-protein] synthase II
MADSSREAWITGIGIVSCLGEGPDAHWQGLSSGQPKADASTFAPYVVHPLAPLDLDKQIPKKGDQRQMEPWQRIGVYAAGLALENAGIKGNPDLLSRTDMIVAAGGGERDCAADSAILTAIRGAEKPSSFLNQRLMSDLRPTLFLAQLSNLLAGNISIVHGVTGSSRTFMGEEAAGVDAVRIALSRINAGQSDLALVGGSMNGERLDMLVLSETGGFNFTGGYKPVWKRGSKGGFLYGSLGAFIVLESRAHADARGAKRAARLSTVVSEHSARKPGDVEASLDRMWGRLGAIEPGGAAILSGASGAEPATSEERAFLGRHGDIAVRATGSYLGHGLEPQFAMNIALAAVALGRGSLFPPADDSGVERPQSGLLRQVVVTGIGHWRGEGLALVEAP